MQELRLRDLQAAEEADVRRRPNTAVNNEGEGREH